MQMVFGNGRGAESFSNNLSVRSCVASPDKGGHSYMSFYCLLYMYYRIRTCHGSRMGAKHAVEWEQNSTAAYLVPFYCSILPFLSLPP